MTSLMDQASSQNRSLQASWCAPLRKNTSDSICPWTLNIKPTATRCLVASTLRPRKNCAKTTRGWARKLPRTTKTLTRRRQTTNKWWWTQTDFCSHLSKVLISSKMWFSQTDFSGPTSWATQTTRLNSSNSRWSRVPTDRVLSIRITIISSLHSPRSSWFSNTPQLKTLAWLKTDNQLSVCRKELHRVDLTPPKPSRFSKTLDPLRGVSSKW